MKMNQNNRIMQKILPNGDSNMLIDLVLTNLRNLRMATVFASTSNGHLVKKNTMES